MATCFGLSQAIFRPIGYRIQICKMRTLARPQVADGGTASDMEGSCE